MFTYRARDDDLDVKEVPVRAATSHGRHRRRRPKTDAPRTIPWDDKDVNDKFRLMSGVARSPPARVRKPCSCDRRKSAPHRIDTPRRAPPGVERRTTRRGGKQCVRL